MSAAENIRSILANQAWYGNGPPRWDGALTSQWAETESRALVRRLRRFGDVFPDADVLADKIAGCAPGHRCASGADPMCARAMQRWLTSNVSRLASAAPAEGHGRYTWHAFSIVAAEAQAPAGKLATVDAKTFTRDVHASIRTTGLADWAIFGGDVSFDDQTQKGLGSFWQYHAHGLVSTRDANRVADAIRTAFQRSVTVPRRVHVDDYDAGWRGASYALKPRYYRRTSYWDWDRSAWQTRPQSLQPRQTVELALMLDGLGFAGRIFGYRACVARQNGAVILKKRRLG